MKLTTKPGFPLKRPSLARRMAVAEDQCPERTDAELEAFIDAAGRAEVFDLALALGWSPTNSPPKWVWGQIAHEVMQSKQAPRQPGTIH